MAETLTNPKATCKFKVEAIEPTPGHPEQEIITLRAVYDESDPEDTKFSAATPWGELRFGLSNPNLLGQFQVGESYYLDLVPVEGDGRRGRL